jgi:hypothetical protein
MEDGIIENYSQNKEQAQLETDTDRLKCKYSQKTEKEIDKEGYLPFI